jgi:Zn-finger nucleic acid-binding protein
MALAPVGPRRSPTELSRSVKPAHACTLELHSIQPATGRGMVERDRSPRGAVQLTLVRIASEEHQMTNSNAEDGITEVEAYDGSRLCPVCGRRMEQQVYRKAQIEVCEQHGVWLDKGELESILEAQAKRAASRLRLHKQLEYDRGRRDPDALASLFWSLIP